MWLYVRKQDEKVRDRIYRALTRRLVDSRFKFDLYRECNRYTGYTRPGLNIRSVRLKRRKEYCGAHPGECQVNPFFNRPHRVYTYLEGLDWVGFNRMVNDTLDDLEVEAWVYSFNREARVHRYFIRRGRERLFNYRMESVVFSGRTFYHWATPEPEDYTTDRDREDEYPYGPGQPVWRLRDEEVLELVH